MTKVFMVIFGTDATIAQLIVWSVAEYGMGWVKKERMHGGKDFVE